MYPLKGKEVVPLQKDEGQLRRSRAEKLLKKEAGSLRKPTLLAAAIAYFLLVLVVIYGAGQHVYDGFGAAAPWIVGGIFLIMAVIRLSEFLRTVNACNRVRRFLRLRDAARQHEQMEK